MDYAEFVNEADNLYDYFTQTRDDMYYQLSIAFYNVAIDILNKEIIMYDGNKRIKAIYEKNRIQSIVKNKKQYAEDQEKIHVIIWFICII